MKRIITIAIIGLFISAVACQSENSDSAPEDGASMVNPNGSSELALLMRQMYDAALHSKNAIIKGNDPRYDVNYENILTASPTDSTMIDYPEFEPLAKSYISAMQRLDTAAKKNAPEAYMAVISTCKSCHTISCPGPMVRIKKLELPSVLVDSK